MNCVLFVKMDQVFSKENKTLKKYWKIGEKILEKSGKSQGILSVRKSGNPDGSRDTLPVVSFVSYRLIFCASPNYINSSHRLFTEISGNQHKYATCHRRSIVICPDTC